MAIYPNSRYTRCTISFIKPIVQPSISSNVHSPIQSSIQLTFQSISQPVIQHIIQTNVQSTSQSDQRNAESTISLYQEYDYRPVGPRKSTKILSDVIHSSSPRAQRSRHKPDYLRY